QYLVERILKEGADLGLTLAFVWNRDPAKLKGLVPDEFILQDLSSFTNRCRHTHTHTHTQAHVFSVTNMRSVFCRRCDLIVEVCHPQIVKEFGSLFLSHAHFMVRHSF
ncbi:unnamed protein product, partial [Tetraodon nigroviridis]